MPPVVETEKTSGGNLATIVELSQQVQPTIRGALRQTPLAEFLVQAYDGGFEGTLLLQTQDRQKSAVLFSRGAPAKARPASPVSSLAEVTVSLGLLEQPLATSTRKRAESSGSLHGYVLRDEGHLDDTGLFVALREELSREVLGLCQLPDTTGFGFYPANYLADWGYEGQWRVKPLPMIWKALVHGLPAPRRDAWLARLGETQIRMRAIAPVSRYAMTQAEQGVIDMIRAMPTSLAKLEASGVGTPALVRQVVCALMLSRQIDLGFEHDPVGLHEPPESPTSIAPPETRAARRTVTAPRAPGVPLIHEQDADPASESGDDESVHLIPSAPHSAPSEHSSGHHAPPSSFGANSARARAITASMRPRSSTSPRPPTADAGGAAALRAEIESYRERDPQNYYEILGLERGATSAEVRAAFFQLARRWHPDRLSAELADLKAYVNETFAMMGEAHQALMDDQRRAEYDKALESAPEDSEQAEVANILRAASAHQRGEILLKKKDYKGAFDEAQLAYELDPTQPDHVALYAWLQGTMRNDNKVDDLIALLSTTLKENPNHVKSLWYRGQLYKKAEQTLKAMKDFKLIMELKPNHVDAAREVRVYSMRRRSDPKAGTGAKPSGLFAAFRKKD